MGTLHVWGECYPIEDPEKSCQLVPYVQERTEKGVTRKGRPLVTASGIPVCLHMSAALASACGLLAETHAQPCLPTEKQWSRVPRLQDCLPMVVGELRVPPPKLSDGHAINLPVVMWATELERKVSVEMGAFQVMTNSSKHMNPEAGRLSWPPLGAVSASAQGTKPFLALSLRPGPKLTNSLRRMFWPSADPSSVSSGVGVSL